jgi:hypothetical protein
VQQISNETVFPSEVIDPYQQYSCRVFEKLSFTNALSNVIANTLLSIFQLLKCSQQGIEHCFTIMG